MRINNYDNGSSPTVDPPIYYSGQTAKHTADLVIDLVKPVHCSVGHTCSDNMLHRGLPFTKSVSSGNAILNVKYA